jgi:hypothetical protein
MNVDTHLEANHLGGNQSLKKPFHCLLGYSLPFGIVTWKIHRLISVRFAGKFIQLGLVRSIDFVSCRIAKDAILVEGQKQRKLVTIQLSRPYPISIDYRTR